MTPTRRPAGQQPSSDSSNETDLLRPRYTEDKAPEPRREVLTVSELTRRIKYILAERFPGVWVSGEVSNLRLPGSGHLYLTLKDETAQLNAVIFRGVASQLRFELEDGLAVIAYGEIDVYEPRGQYQLVVRHLEPKGYGALQLAFEQLKRRLEKEGLFDPAHKKPLPFLPSTIGIVTSPSGAAIRDILRMIDRRFPRVHVLIYPVRVQGSEAAGEIAQAIRDLNRIGGIDVMIVGRGGGSLEDLWPFNEEIVARSIYDSRIPIISAVGHEIDVTISDLVADVRALTPTNAGEIVVPNLKDLLEEVDDLRRHLARSLGQKLKAASERLEVVRSSYAFRRPKEPILRRVQLLDDMAERIGRGIAAKVHAQKLAAEHLAARLEALSPLSILRRGYSITSLEGSSKPIRNALSVARGSRILTRLHKGNLVSEVLRVSPEGGGQSGQN